MVKQRRRSNGSSRKLSSSGSSTDSSDLMPMVRSKPKTLSDELAALLECPVCLDIILPPIMQCYAGHLVCARCRQKLSYCPTCRGILGNIRNLAMEKVADKLMFRCKHREAGCRVSLGLNEKAEHEETCEFRPYNCPCPGGSCLWQGQLENVMEHFQHAHENILNLDGEDIVFLATDINVPGCVDWIMLQSCFGHHFMVVLEKQEQCDGRTQFSVIVQLIGSRKQADNFAYKLELADNSRRLTWQAMPRSSRDGVTTAILDSDCLVFNSSTAQLFADDNGNLSVIVTIIRAAE